MLALQNTVVIVFTVYAVHLIPVSTVNALLSPHAIKHAGDISFTVSVFVTLFVWRFFCNG